MKKEQVIQDYEKYILSTYTRTPVVIVKGKGMNLTDVHGKTYLDFFPGWGVNNVGHCHPKVMAGVRDQIGKLIHIPNNFYHPNQVKLAKEIVRQSFSGKVFFCNSGAEGCEAAIKFARAHGNNEKFEVITMMKSFHGRTLGAMTATGQPEYSKWFHPLPAGFKSVAFNDLQAAKDAVTPQTAAIMLELVQGEGGIHVADKTYVQELRRLCDKNGILLIFDEVQTGMGRTGEMFAFKHYGVSPDIMILAKALGGGLPIGAIVVRDSIAETFQPGMHASTFGGSPLICKAALGAFQAIKSDNMLANAKAMGKFLFERLTELSKKYRCVTQVRGIGLMLGIELKIPGKPIVDKCLAEGLIINCTQKNVLRIMPALNVTERQIKKALRILDAALAEADQLC